MNATADSLAIDRYAQLRACLAHELHALPDKPEETVDATLRALWYLAAGHALSAAAACETGTLPALDAAADARLTALVQTRLAGVPLAHLTRRQRFLDLELEVGPQALIPRRETELLARAVVARLNAVSRKRTQLAVIDVCTGAGNLALAAALGEPRAFVHASDLAPAAAALCRRNAERLGLAARVAVRTGDLLAPFDTPLFQGAIDMLICNPPYISAHKVDALPAEIGAHEPRLAFDGGPLGIGILVRLAREAPRYLRAGGWLAVEVGHGQGQAYARRLAGSGQYGRIETLRDGAGEIRAVLARRSADASRERT